MEQETPRVAALRDRLSAGLQQQIPQVTINGPQLQNSVRLAGNLNCTFQGVDGEALMMSVREVAVSSGSACTAANPEPSHVLRSLGLGVDDVRSSLRFGVGRYNTEEEIDFAVGALAQGVDRLRRLSGQSPSAT